MAFPIFQAASRLLVLVALSGPTVSAQQLDGSWTVAVGGQSSAVAADGSFHVVNVSAPDMFGAAGPGSPPDFISDEFVRVIATRQVAGNTEYAFSDPFKVTQGKTSFVGALTFTGTPPPVPVSVRLSFPVSSIQVGQPLSATVIAQLGDGTALDVTPASSWTTYKVSNPGVATVSGDGLVNGISTGIVLVTALNDGALSVSQVLVVDPADRLTTVVGTVQDELGTLLAGATVKIAGLPLQTTTQADGSFSIPGVPTFSVGSFVVQASATVGGVPLTGSQSGVIPEPGGLTDAGILVLSVSKSILVYGVRIDGISQGQCIATMLNARGFDATFSATLPPDLSPYGAIWDAQTISGLSTANELALQDFVNSGRGLHLSGERPCCEAANQSVESVVSALTGKAISFGGIGDTFGPYTVQATVLGGLASAPHALATLPLNGAGGITGLAVTDPHVLARDPVNRVVAVAFDSNDILSGAGRISVVMDTDWEILDVGCSPTGLTADVVENIATFLLFK